jgi:hypothetical protein
MVNTGYGIKATSTGYLVTAKPASSTIKTGTNTYQPLVPFVQHESAFYGLAKAAGDSTQSASSNAVGTYTDAAKIAIQKMLGVYEAPFRLIKTISITEARGAIYVNADDNLEPFSLTEMIVHFDKILGSNNGTGGISVNNGNASSVATGAFLTINNLFNSSTAQTRVAELQVRGGRFFGKAMGANVTASYGYSNDGGNTSAYGLVACDPIHEFLIGSFNSYNFVSGTITVYGR